VTHKPIALALLGGAVVLLNACSALPTGNTTVTNGSGEMIRVTGNCVPDDAQTLMPGQTTNDAYSGAQCRIDDGDGLHGVLACVTLSVAHTDITRADLKQPPRPDQCWGSGHQ
jgi:hypothetical protein